MKKIAIILRRPPYGDINAAEAVRHAMGAASEELETSLILVDGGALLSKKGQDMGDSGYTNLGETLKDCMDMGVAVYVEKASLRELNLETGEILEGVRTVNSTEIAELLQGADHSMIF